MNENLIEKAKECKTVEELITLAKEKNMEMSLEQANAAFSSLHPTKGELSDEELNNVAGGCGEEETLEERIKKRKCPNCGKSDFWTDYYWDQWQHMYTTAVHHCVCGTLFTPQGTVFKP